MYQISCTSNDSVQASVGRTVRPMVPVEGMSKPPDWANRSL